mgnify:CR=1 FL=1
MVAMTVVLGPAFLLALRDRANLEARRSKVNILAEKLDQTRETDAVIYSIE